MSIDEQLQYLSGLRKWLDSHDGLNKSDVEALDAIILSLAKTQGAEKMRDSYHIERKPIARRGTEYIYEDVDQWDQAAMKHACIAYDALKAKP